MFWVGSWEGSTLGWQGVQVWFVLGWIMGREYIGMEGSEGSTGWMGRKRVYRLDRKKGSTGWIGWKECRFWLGYKRVEVG